MATGAINEFVAQFDDDHAKDFLNELIRGRELEDAGLGIAKLVIDKGPGGLSEKQAYVFEQAVRQHWTPSCVRCGGDIPWPEQYAAKDNGGLCSWCWHMSTKDE